MVPEVQQIFQELGKQPLEYGSHYLSSDPREGFYIFPDSIKGKQLLPEHKYELLMNGFCWLNYKQLIELNRTSGEMSIGPDSTHPKDRSPILNKDCQFSTKEHHIEDRLFKINVNDQIYQRYFHDSWNGAQEIPREIYAMLPDKVLNEKLSVPQKKHMLTHGSVEIRKKFHLVFFHQVGIIRYHFNPPYGQNAKHLYILKEKDCSFMDQQQEKSQEKGRRTTRDNNNQLEP
jgi:hypothetical protein